MKPTSDATYGTSKVKPEALVQCVCIASNYGHVIGMICYSSRRAVDHRQIYNETILVSLVLTYAFLTIFKTIIF